MQYKKAFIILLIVSVISLNITVFAYESRELVCKSDDYDFNIASIEGVVYKEDINLNGESKAEATINNMNLTISDEIYLTGGLMYDGNIHKISLEGNIYPFDGGVHEGNLVLGDLKSADDRFSVINFRVFGKTKDKYLINNNMNLIDKSTISLVMKDLKSDNIIFFQFGIDKSIFEKMLMKSRAYIKYLKLDENSKISKLISLYKYDKNENKSNTEVVDGGEHQKLIEMDLETKGSPAISYHNLKSFIDALNSNGTAKLSDYNIPSTFMTNTGWHHFSNTNSTPRFCYSNYSSSNGTGHYISEFSLIDILANDNYVGQDINEVTLQLGLYGGALVEYWSYNDTADVIYYGLGLKISNIGLAISKLEGNLNNIFIERDVNGILVNSNNNYVMGLAGLVPYGKFLKEIWEFSSECAQSNVIYGNEYNFGNTVSEQKARYNQKLVRAVYADSGSAYMNSSSNYFKLDGNINDNIRMYIDSSLKNDSYKI